MSKQIDERVVSMQFDNRHFESNVKTTMSTLEKLKHSLNLSGASKGLESINTAVKKVDMTGFANGVEKVSVKFNALYSIADQTLRNITTRVQQTAENMVKSLTITPITTGFNEYELKMGSIQTIMASTGESLATVNEYLNELNTYSDQTIYSFQDMTQNIGKFTNAGVKLEDAVLAIKGIANEAAVSGANANEASRAMYNFAQALSTGYIQRIDWKSIELANMATVEFKEQLLNSAIAMKTVEKNAEGMWRVVGDDTWYNTSQMFIETLDEQWLTSEVLIDTLKDYADETTDIGKKAKAAATEVKTFSMMMDTLRESAQSGWAQTWEIIVGDFDEAKNLFTMLSDVIGGWINKSSEKRNALFSEVLDSNWEKLIKQINEAGVSTEEFEQAIRNSAKAQKELTSKNKTLDELVKEYGSLGEVFQSGALSADVLTEALESVDKGASKLELTIDRLLKKGTNGDDVKQMQKVLKQLGYDLGKFGENADGLDGKFGSVTQAAVRAFQEANNLTVDGVVGPETLAALEKAADELNKANNESKGLVENVKGLVKNIDNLGGRQKLIKAISTLWEKMGKIVDSVKQGFANVFGESDIAGSVVKIIDNFSKWVDELEITKTTLDSIESIISGICAAIQTGAILGGGLFGILSKIVNTAIRFAGLDLITVLGDIGDAIVKFRQFLIDDNKLGDFLDSLGTKLANGLELVYTTIGQWADAIGAWFNRFLQLEKVKYIVSNLSRNFSAFIRETGQWLGEFGDIFGDFFRALSSLNEISFDAVWGECQELWERLVDHFGSLDFIIRPLIQNVKALGWAFLDYIGLDNAVINMIDWFDDARKTFQDWRNEVEGSEDLPKIVAESIVEGIGVAVKAVVNVLSEIWTKIISLFSKDPKAIAKSMTEGGSSMALGLIAGFIDGIWDGIRFVGEVMLELGKIAVDKLSEVFTKEGFGEVATNTIAGFVNGIRDGASNVWNAMIELGKSILEKIKAVLGIHSPSTEMYEVGQNTTQGFINGFEDALPVVWEVIKGFGRKFLDLIMDIDFGQIMAGALAGGTIYGIVKLAKAISSFSNLLDSIAGIADGVKDVLGGVKGVLDAFASIEKSIAGYIDAKKWAVRAEAMKSFAIAIAILAASVIALTFIDPGKLWASIGAIAALSVIMAGLTFAISKMGDGADGAVKIGKFALLIVSFGLVIFLMSKVVKQVAKLSWEELARGCTGLIIFAGLMAGLIAATNLIAKTAKGNTATAVFKIGTMLLGIASAMIVFAIAAKMIAKMEWGEMAKAGTGLLALGGFMVGMIAATNLIAKTARGNTATAVYKTGTMLLGIAAAMVILVVAAKMIAKMDTGAMIKAGVGLLALSGLIVGLIAATKLAGPDIDKVGGTIFKIAAAMLILSITAKIIAGMEWGEMAKAGVGLAALGGIIVGLVAATKLASDKDILKAGVMILMLSFTVAVLAVVATLFGMLSVEHLAKGVIAVGLLGLIVAAMIYATRGASDCHKNIMMMAIAIATMAVAVVALSFIDTTKLFNATTALMAVIFAFTVLVKASESATGKLGNLIVLTGAIVILGGILYLLSTLPIESTLSSAVALSAVILAFAAAMKAASKLTSLNSVEILKTMGILILVVGALAGILYLMRNMNPGQAIGMAGALSLFLYAMMGALLIISKVRAVSINAMVGLAVMTLVVGALAGILYLLRGLNPEQALGTTAALSALLLSLSLACVVASMARGTTVMALASVAVMTLVVAALAGVLYLLRDLDPEQALATSKALSTLLLSLSAACAILGVVGLMGPAAFVGIGALMTLILAVGTLVTVIGALVNKFPALETFLDKGIPVLEKIGFALGSFFGNIVGGFSKGVADGLPGIGANLSAFMTNAMPFVTGIKMVDESVMNGARAIAETVLILTTADILDGLTSWFTGGSSLVDLGAELAEFGPYLKAFADSVAGIDSASVTAATEAAKTLVEMANLVPNEGGMVAWFAGENSLAAFGPQIASFGLHLKQFANNVSGVNIETITGAAQAGKVLAEMANTIPNSGGIAAWFAGENSFAAFSAGLPGLGTNMALFVSNLGTFTEAQVTTVTCVANALKELAAATDTIPNEGGLAAWFAGENSLSTFSANLPSLGSNMAAFVTNLGTFSDGQVTAVACVAAALKELALATNTIPNEGGIASWFAGDNSLASFSGSLPALGTNMAAFVTNLGSFSEGQVSTVRSAVSAIRAFATLADSDLGNAKKNLSGFGDKLADFGSDLADFCSELDGDVDVSTAVTNMKTIIDATKGITDGSVSALKDLGKALKDFGEDGVDGFVSAFTSSKSKEDVKAAAAELAEKVVDGCETKTETIKTAFKDLASAGATAIKSETIKAKFSSAGKYVVEGFTSGITTNTFKAEAAAKAMASAALSAAKEALNINSPSREFYAIGLSAGEGFTKAFTDYESDTTKAGSSMANSALSGLRDAFTMAKDIVENGVDAQPTIRPVVDLNGVTADADKIASLFDMNPSVGVMANVGAISRGMARSQNGSANADVVSAIDKLNNKMDSVRGNTYSINGITYSEGTELAEAIQTIVRHAKIERRV